MNTIRLLAAELQLSRATVAAALRGVPWVKAATRRRILRRAEKRGYVATPCSQALAGTVGILRLKDQVHRGRPAVERHRVISRAAREAAYESGYGLEEIVIRATALDQLPKILDSFGHCGLLVLPVPNEGLLSRVWTLPVPCVYADIPADALNVDSVCTDYYQGILLAVSRLRASGFNRPGLTLDDNLPLPVRERMLSAYSLAFATGKGPAPPPILTPVRTRDVFDSWLSRHSFDALLVTDSEHARRLTPELALPIFGMLPEMTGVESGLNLNLSAVGRHAFEMLHNRLRCPSRSSSPSHVLLSASWGRLERGIATPGVHLDCEKMAI